jgi:serine/threonine-protein kinase
VHTTEQLNTALAGRYVVERQIGAGGMATVYLARDLRHDRPVALKVLNPELGAVLGGERFLSEIHVTANLQHPNLLPLFDSGEAEGLLFYVMPFVEGESLRARLDREKQLPIDDSIRIAAAVGGALDYAHRHAVIHRDLKPENILLHDGQPLVADFGIALAVSNAGGQRITQTGLSLGTPQYMSPEQATGDRTLDARSDIYSLGAVLYEMLTGEPPHQGNTAQAIIAKVITDRPRPVLLTRDTVPPHVAAAVERALAKLPADRFASASAFIAALSSDLPSVVTRVPPPQEPRWGRRAAVVAIGVGVGAALSIGWFVDALRLRTLAEAPAIRFTLPEVSGKFTMQVGATARFAVSPDGRTIAFLGHSTGVARDSGAGIYVRTIDQIEPRLLAADAGVRHLAFSPDGKWVAWATADNSLFKVRAEGGPVTALASIPAAALGLRWLGMSDVIVGTYGPLYDVPVAGGAIHAITHPDSATWDTWPLVAPDGKRIIFARLHSGSQLRSLDLATGRLDSLGTGTAPLAIFDGMLAYVTEAGILRVAKMDHGGRSLGTAIDVVHKIMMGQEAEAKAQMSPAGTLVYVSGKQDGLLTLVSDRGTTTLSAEAHAFLSPRFSPDGRRIAVAVEPDIWLFDRATATLTRMTSEAVNDSPEWTPDGKRIVFIRNSVGTTRGASGQPGVWWRAADGGDQPSLLYSPPDLAVEAIMSPDAEWLAYRTAALQPHFRDLMAVRLGGDRKPIPIVTTTRFSEYDPRVSPDGHWIAYQSDESGRREIYAQRFPEGGSRAQISADGGAMPLWDRAGRALFYMNGNSIVRVSVTMGATLGVGERKVVATGDWWPGFVSHPNYDVAPDGSTLLVVRPAPDALKTVVVYQWSHELRSVLGR